MNVISAEPLIMDLINGIFVYLATSYVLGHYTIKTVSKLYRWVKGIMT